MMSFSISMILSYLMAVLAMAFYTLMERKLLGYMQLRKGPNKIMLAGIPQPIADAMKLFFKEQSYPTMSNYMLFTVAPIMSLILALLLWAIYPHSNSSLYLTFGILYFLCVSSMNVYATFLSGWCSNSKYSLLGALRGVAQTISYEVSMSLILISMLFLHKKMDMSLMTTNMMTWPMILIPIMFFLWFVTNLAETNRAPFDFAEGESELVSGFNTEYSGGLFALIFMAEYASILMMSVLTMVFFSGSLMMFPSTELILKSLMMAAIFIWVRASFPRMRYDNLMNLTWKSFLPISLSMMMLLIIIM